MREYLPAILVVDNGANFHRCGIRVDDFVLTLETLLIPLAILLLHLLIVLNCLDELALHECGLTLC